MVARSFQKNSFASTSRGHSQPGVTDSEARPLLQVKGTYTVNVLVLSPGPNRPKHESALSLLVALRQGEVKSIPTQNGKSMTDRCSQHDPLETLAPKQPGYGSFLQQGFVKLTRPQEQSSLLQLVSLAVRVQLPNHGSYHSCWQHACSSQSPKHALQQHALTHESQNRIN